MKSISDLLIEVEDVAKKFSNEKDIPLGKTGIKYAFDQGCKSSMARDLFMACYIPKIVDMLKKNNIPMTQGKFEKMLDENKFNAT